MPNTIEELFKKSNDEMQARVFNPVVLNALAERGYQVNEKQAADVLALVDQIREGVASGQIAPVPVSALEQDGSLSKHAAAAVQEDFLRFAPDFEIDVNDVDEHVKNAAAGLILCEVAAAE